MFLFVVDFKQLIPQNVHSCHRRVDYLVYMLCYRPRAGAEPLQKTKCGLEIDSDDYTSRHFIGNYPVMSNLLVDFYHGLCLNRVLSPSLPYYTTQDPSLSKAVCQCQKWAHPGSESVRPELASVWQAFNTD